MNPIPRLSAYMRGFLNTELSRGRQRADLGLARGLCVSALVAATTYALRYLIGSDNTQLLSAWTSWVMLSVALYVGFLRPLIGRRSQHEEETT